MDNNNSNNNNNKGSNNSNEFQRAMKYQIGVQRGITLPYR